MEPSFTRGEYWLLESVVELDCPLSVLLSENLGLALNKRGHGLDRVRLVEALVRLFSDELIIAANDAGGLFKPQRDEIEAALDEPDNARHTHYALTEEGGRQWEQFAMPDWDVFVSDERSLDQRRGTVIGARKDWVRKYISDMQYVGMSVDEASVEWDIVEPWQATYWKVLPRGHRVRFRCSHNEDWGWEQVPYTCAVVQKWYAWG